MGQRMPRKTGGTGDHYYLCALCQDDGKMDERAEKMILLRSRADGREEWVSVCSAHSVALGRPGSPFEIVGGPILGVSEELLRAKGGSGAEAGGKKSQGGAYGSSDKRSVRKKLRNPPKVYRD